VRARASYAPDDAIYRRRKRDRVEIMRRDEIPPWARETLAR
jgi:hypothetical protein